MNVKQIISAFTPAMTNKKADKIVKMASSTIPGESYKQISQMKKDIAVFAKENKIKNVEIYDARRDLDNCEDLSPSTEERFGGMVGISLKRKKGAAQYGHLDYFSNENNFMSAFFEKLGAMAEKLKAK